jgi:hypothetical protein
MASFANAPFPGLSVSVQQVYDMVKKRNFDFGHATEILAASTHANRQHPEIHIMETGYEKQDGKTVELEPDWHVDPKTRNRPMHTMFRSAEAAVEALVAVLNTQAGELGLTWLSTKVGQDKPVYIYSRSAADRGDAEMVARTKLPNRPPEYPVQKISWVVTGLVRGKKGDYLTIFTHYPVIVASLQNQAIPPADHDLVEYTETATVPNPEKAGKKMEVRRPVHQVVPVEYQTY